MFYKILLILEKQLIMKNKKKLIIILFVILSLQSCVYDFVNDDLKVVNNSQKNYIVHYFDFTLKSDSLKDKKEMNEKILSLYNRWDENKVDKNNYYKSENIYGYYVRKINGFESISTRGTSIPDSFRFYFINIDLLFDNYQKGLPVDSFKSYEIKKYTKEELKRTNNQINIKE
jgi:hypothetical protein